MDYFGAYRYLFTNPRWGMNLLWISVAQLVPILGPMAVLGYVAEMIDELSKDRRAPCPDFQPDRIADYLVRGLWPILASLILGLAGMLLAGVAILPMLLIQFLGLNFRWLDGPLGIALWLLGVTLVLVTTTVITFLTIPVTLAAMKARSIGPAFQAKYLGSFLSTSWLDLLTVWLFLMVTAFPLMIAGMMLFCVGIYPASALISVALWLLASQVYERHLAKGGQPIPKPAIATEWT
ncbi:hypothetical protein BH23PLA1_BH23PLA1_14740 [soil metagenome]